MGKKANIQGYLEYVHAPWGKLFYKLAWHNIECKGKRILDFGSGFGNTANHFAKYNNVIAVEPNREMLKHQFADNHYEQLIGGIEILKNMPSQSFDVIICHNVMEYLNDREELLFEFNRLLKTNGFPICLPLNAGQRKFLNLGISHFFIILFSGRECSQIPRDRVAGYLTHMDVCASLRSVLKFSVFKE